MNYEVTITLRPRLYKYKPEEQFNRTKELLREIFTSFNVSLVAELTGENNVHYHGMVYLKDHLERNKLLNRFRRYSDSFGRKSCTQLVREDLWKAYLCKSITQTKEILGTDPVVRDHFGIEASPGCISQTFKQF